MAAPSLMPRLGLLLLYALIQFLCAVLTSGIPVLLWKALAHSVLAALLARLVNAPWWWIALHAVLPLLGWGLLAVSVPPAAYLGAFVILMLFFGSGSLRRAPLFLSGPSAWQQVAGQLPAEARVLDAGCGFAGMLKYLYKHRPDLHLSGAELAWLPALVCRLRCHGTPIQILRTDFWALNWGSYDVVFAFLSPDPMPTVWEKFQKETKPGTWLISYHFEVPGQPPTWIAHDDQGHPVYGWKKH